jgi:hypothetical protein
MDEQDKSAKETRGPNGRVGLVVAIAKQQDRDNNRKETRAYRHDQTFRGFPERPIPRSTRRPRLRPSRPGGGRTPGPGLPTRWVCYERPGKKVRIPSHGNRIEPDRRTSLAGQGIAPRPRAENPMVPRAPPVWQEPEQGVLDEAFTSNSALATKNAWPLAWVSLRD